MIKNLTEKEIREMSVAQLCGRVSRLQFDEEAGCNILGDKEQIELIEKVLKERLIKMLKRDFYPPEHVEEKKSLTSSLSNELKRSEAKILAPLQSKPKFSTETKIKFRIIVTSSIGTKVAQFNVEANSKDEADIEAGKMIRKLGLKGTTYKIS